MIDFLPFKYYRLIKKRLKCLFCDTTNDSTRFARLSIDMLGAKLGENVSIIEPVSPVIFSSEPYLVSIGDNTTISFDVVFVTHDASTRVIRHLPDGNSETVIYGPIEVGCNCLAVVQ